MADAPTTTPVAPKPAQAATANPTQAKVDAASPTKPQTTQVMKPPPFKIAPMVSNVKYGKFMFYAIPGGGKTWLAGSSVDVKGMRDVLIANAEGGTLTIETAIEIENRHLIDSVPIANFTTVGYIQEFLKAHCAARDANDIPRLKALQARMFGYSVDIIDETCTDDEWYLEDEDDASSRVYTRVRLRKYRTIILDSLSEINAYLIMQLLGITLETKFDAAAMEETAGWDEYKKGNQMLQMVLRAYRDLPMHVIFICGTQYTQDHQKQFRWTPSLIGKLGTQVQGFVDVAGYLAVQKPTEDDMAKGKVPRRLYIQPIGSFEAKNRLSSFKDSHIPDPTMQKIMDIFRGVVSTMKTATAKAPVKK